MRSDPDPAPSGPGTPAAEPPATPGAWPGAVLLRRERVHRGPVIDLEIHDVRLPNGVEARLQIALHPGAAAVVPLHEDGSVVLVRQLRYAAANGYLLEVPAGKLDPGEAPARCAARELEEETGLRAASFEPLVAIWPTPGFCDERIHIFLARGLTEGEARREADEVLVPVRIAFDEALARIDRGDITDGKTIAALAAAAIRLRRGPLA